MCSNIFILEERIPLSGKLIISGDDCYQSSPFYLIGRVGNWMGESIEKLLYLIADSESIVHDDELTQMINIEVDSELSEAELEWVSAARKERYENFIQFLKGKGIE